MSELHTHEHGNHSHTHAHVGDSPDHRHGWHHGPEHDQGDASFGEEPGRVVAATAELPIEIHGSPAAAPIVVVPYVPGQLRPETAAALEETVPGWWAVDVSGTEWDYWHLLAELVRDGEDFVNVEQDVVPHAGFLESFDECPRIWCGFSYWLPEKELSVADYGRAEGITCGSTALGCVRIRASQLPPNLFDLLADRTWSRLDAAVTQILTGYGEACCRHLPDVGHARPRRVASAS